MVYLLFWLKTGIDFPHQVLKSGMVFKGTTTAQCQILLNSERGLNNIDLA